MTQSRRQSARKQAASSRKQATFKKQSSPIPAVEPVWRTAKKLGVKQPRIDEVTIERYARVIFQVICAKFPNCEFTRDDILLLVSEMRITANDTWAPETYGMNDVAMSTRYRKICLAIRRMLTARQLVALDYVRLCLPTVAEQLQDRPSLVDSYLHTMRRLIQSNFKPKAIVDAMILVDHWKTDQHISHNVKRMTAFRILPVLLREGVIKRGDDQQFIVAG